MPNTITDNTSVFILYTKFLLHQDTSGLLVEVIFELLIALSHCNRSDAFREHF